MAAGLLELGLGRRRLHHRSLRNAGAVVLEHGFHISRMRCPRFWCLGSSVPQRQTCLLDESRGRARSAWLNNCCSFNERQEFLIAEPIPIRRNGCKSATFVIRLEGEPAFAEFSRNEELRNVDVETSHCRMCSPSAFLGEVLDQPRRADIPNLPRETILAPDLTIPHSLRPGLSPCVGRIPADAVKIPRKNRTTDSGFVRTDLNLWSRLGDRRSSLRDVDR